MTTGALEEFLRAEERKRKRSWKYLFVQSGTYTVNEVREALGLPRR